MDHKVTEVVAHDDAEYINRLMEHEPENEDECLGEDDTIHYTADFGEGYQMDVDICGVQYDEGGMNIPWTQSVLFLNGCEVAYSEPSEGFFGEWQLDNGKGDTFTYELVAG